MVDPSKAVANRFDDIITRCDSNGRPSGLPHAERVLFYIVAVRCEADMNGFCSVFEQLLDRDDLAFFVAALRELQEADLADTYERIGVLLEESGYFPDLTIRFHKLPAPVLARFDLLEKQARAGNLLWGLDQKLLVLFERQTQK